MHREPWMMAEFAAEWRHPWSKSYRRHYNLSDKRVGHEFEQPQAGPRG